MEVLGQFFIPVIAFGLILLVTVVDLLLRKDLGASAKAGWFCVALLPFIGSLIYAISTRRRFVLVSCIVIILGLAFFYGTKYYLTHKPARAVENEKGMEVTAQQIFDDFTTNEAAANQKYLNKAIQVTGEVAEVKKNLDNKTVVLLKTSDPVFGVNCTFKTDPGVLQPGGAVTFKGICTGFLSDVVINEGVIVKK
jgi:uncharacterized membrane protein